MTPVKSRLIASVSLSLALAAFVQADEPRTFTASDGSAEPMEVIAATSNNVTLRKAGGEIVMAPIKAYSAEDQTFIAAWHKDHPRALSTNFTITYSPSKIATSKKKVSNDTYTVDSWAGNIKITNQTGAALAPIGLRYTIYYRQFNGTSPPEVATASGYLRIVSFKNGEELAVPTKVLNLQTNQYKPFVVTSKNNVSVHGKRRKTEEELLGITVTLSPSVYRLHEQSPFFTWSAPGTPDGVEAAAAKRGFREAR